MSYNLNKISVNSVKQLEEFVTDEEIYRYYLKHDFIPGAKYKSPLPGRDDKDPSFQILYKNGKLVWRDYGYVPDKRLSMYPNNAIVFAHIMLGSISINETIQQIYDDIILGNNTLSKEEIQKIKINALKGVYSAGVRIKQKMDPYEIAYWINLGVTKELIDRYNIYGTEAAFFNNKLWRKSVPKDPLFTYLFSKEEEQWQLYRPYAGNGSKFRGHNTTEVIMGWDQLPTRGQTLIITKSMKDLLVLESINFISIAPMSEKRFADLIPLADEINSRFNHVYIMFDNDKTGKDCAQYLNNHMPHWRPFFFHANVGKDPSEVLINFDQNYLKRVLYSNLKL